MPSGSHSESCQVGSLVFNRAVNKTADNATIYGDSTSPITLVAGSAGSSWVKTDADTAACDVAAASTVDTGKVDVYWDLGIRYGVDCVRTVDALALDGGEGTDFPANAEDTIIVANQQQVNVSLDGDLAEIVGVKSTVRAHADFQDVSDNSIRAIELQADEPDIWDSDKAANPYTGEPITKAMVSNGTIVAGTFSVGVLQDSTP